MLVKENFSLTSTHKTLLVIFLLNKEEFRTFRKKDGTNKIFFVSTKCRDLLCFVRVPGTSSQLGTVDKFLFYLCYFKHVMRGISVSAIPQETDLC